MKTYLPKAAAIERHWHVADAEGAVLGRLATRIATVLMGKDKPSYTDFLDTGDFVIVINAEKIRLSGNKLDSKFYRAHSGRPGNLKEASARQLLARHPERLVHSAVKGMLPKNKLGKQMIRKLKVYAGDSHPHKAQKPQPLAI